MTGTKINWSVVGERKISVSGGNFYAAQIYEAMVLAMEGWIAKVAPENRFLLRVSDLSGVPAKMSDLGGFPPVLTGTAQISPQTWQLVWIQAGAGTHSTGTLEPLYFSTLVHWYSGIL